jgi:hypothetical protein
MRFHADIPVNNAQNPCLKQRFSLRQRLGLGPISAFRQHHIKHLIKQVGAQKMGTMAFGLCPMAIRAAIYGGLAER